MAVEMAPHALIRGQGPRNLEQLDKEKHGYPGQLECCPAGEKDGVRVFMQNLA
jgi:hypothetical protein